MSRRSRQLRGHGLTNVRNELVVAFEKFHSYIREIWFRADHPVDGDSTAIDEHSHDPKTAR